ncbi:MAG: hypothetical protein AAF957_08405 [Planctomycetota bacterium]
MSWFRRTESQSDDSSTRALQFHLPEGEVVSGELEVFSAELEVSGLDVGATPAFGAGAAGVGSAGAL